jgi:predicted dehydrogenase
LVLRYSPHYQKIKEIVASGQIGELISFEFNETLGFNHGGYIFGNWRRSRATAGTHLLEKCCHDLDLANWIIGSRLHRAASFGGRDFFLPKNSSHVARIGPDATGKAAYSIWPDARAVDPFSDGCDIVDNQVAIMEYQSGVRATFHTNCNTAIPERRFYLCGTEGTLRGDVNIGLIEVKRIENDCETVVLDSGSRNGHGGGDEVMAEGLVRTLLDEVPPLATVDDGIRACVAAFGIDQAMEEGTVVDFQALWEQVER